MKKIIIIAICAVFAVGAYFAGDIIRIAKLNALTEPDQVFANFRSTDTIFKTKLLKKSAEAYVLPEGEAITLPKNFDYKGQTLNTEQFLKDSATSGLLVLKNNNIVYQQYSEGDTEDSRHISFSMSKSLISALIGIAIEEGKIKSIKQALTDYVPMLKNTGYDGVTIEQALNMASGVKFNEDYADPDSDINRFGQALALGDSFDEFAASLVREKEPGTFHHYVSIDTQVLGMALTRATGKTITEYSQEKIWSKIGTEHDAYWIVDDYGMEMALGGLNASLRDYTRLGRLYLNQGNWNGEQIVPKQWVIDSLKTDKPYLTPGKNSLSTSIWGYGYQWWIPEDPDGDFMAVGIYNQFIYVYPKQNLIITKLSSNLKFTDNDSLFGKQTISLFKAIAASLAKAEVAEEITEAVVEEKVQAKTEITPQVQ